MSIERSSEEFLTKEDFGKKAVSRVTLEQINGHPVENGFVETDLNQDKTKKIRSPRITEGQISMEEIMVRGQNSPILTDSEIIGKTSTDLPLFKNEDIDDIYHKKTKKQEKEEVLIDLRKQQFLRIKEVQEEMKKNGDKRHLFIIPRGVLVENYSGRGKDFFKGNLSQDVLAVNEENYLRLIPLIPEEKIIVNFYSPRFGDRLRKEISSYKARNEVIKKFDLTKLKVKDGHDLSMVLPLRK